jgi:hypothetical protein
VSLAHPNGTAEDYRFLPLHKPAASQVVDMLGGHLVIEVEIKFLQALPFFKVSFAHPSGQSLISPALHFILEKKLKELNKTDTVFLCLAKP